MEKILNENYSDFFIVCEYLQHLESNDVSIRLYEDHSHFFSNSEDHIIVDETVLKSLDSLNSLGCYFVSKNTGENNVAFALWYRGADVSGGLLYRIDTNREPQMDFLTELSETPIKGWFTYVEDYNEWRKKQ